MSLLVLAPTRDGLVLVGDSMATPAGLDGGLELSEPKTEIVNDRVAIGLTGATYLPRIFGPMVHCAYERVGSEEDFLDELPAMLPRYLRAVFRAYESEPTLVVSLVVLQAGVPPRAARYLIRAELGYAAERDILFHAAPDAIANVGLFGLFEYTKHFAIDGDDEVRARVADYVARRIADVPLADGVAMARLIHERASTSSVPVNVLRARYDDAGIAHDARGYIGGPLTGVVVTRDGVRALTEEECQ